MLSREAFVKENKLPTDRSTKQIISPCRVAKNTIARGNHYEDDFHNL